MAYIPGYKYDIFLSYSHVDNETISGQRDGWIELFYKNLNLLLAKRMGRMDTVKIWWDNKKLDGSRLFDISIEEGIKNSAIMLSLISPGYLESKYCKQELELFYKKAQQEPVGLKVHDHSRILNILLNNIPYSQWPNEIRGTTGFPFHDALHVNDFGDPIDIGNPQFTNKMKDLRDAIVTLFGNFQKETSASQESIVPVEEKQQDGFKIYFGEVSDSLRGVKKRTISDLEKKGYTILTGVPPPDNAEAHEQKAKEELIKSDLAIHLLDQYPGREIVGNEEIWYPQKQAELSLQFAKSKAIWVPAELEIEEVEEENYKIFLKEIEAGKQSADKYEYIRGAKSTLTQEITDLAELLKSQHQQTEVKGKLSVLLDTHFNDQIYAMDVGKALLENQIQPFINPQEDDPRKNINLLADRISQVTKLIFFYGIVSRDWVLERMSAALQLIITNNYPIEDFYIFMAPPHKEPDDISLKQRFLKVNVINNSENTYLRQDALQLLLRDLKGNPS